MNADTNQTAGRVGKKTAVVLIGLVVLAALPVLAVYGRPWWVPLAKKVMGRQTVAQAVERYGPEARPPLEPRFQEAGVAYPPKRVVFLASKAQASLEVWAGDTDEPLTQICVYRIKKLSGNPGPKLREGDRQVPEGVYAIEGLNPNSS